MTLLELIVVLAILGLVLGVSGLALTSLKVPRESETARAIRAARDSAIHSGHPVRLHSARPPFRPTALFLPDGRAIGQGVDPLTGAQLDSAR